MRQLIGLAAVVALLAMAGAAGAQGTAKTDEGLAIFFESGSARIPSAERPKLDQASRTYRDGQPVVMIISGSTDSAGAAAANLRLSLARANAVVSELVARGIPAERFQVVGKGETESANDEQGRMVAITWR